MKEVSDWVSQYQQFWDNKLDSLESYLAKIQKKKKQKDGKIQFIQTGREHSYSYKNA